MNADELTKLAEVQRALDNLLSLWIQDKGTDWGAVEAAWVALAWLSAVTGAGITAAYADEVRRRREKLLAK